MNDDDFGILIAKSILAAFLTISIVVGGIVMIYNLSGQKDRDDAYKFDCKSLGGQILYVRGTGNVCIKGIIRIED